MKTLCNKKYDCSPFSSLSFVAGAIVLGHCVKYRSVRVAILTDLEVFELPTASPEDRYLSAGSGVQGV